MDSLDHEIQQAIGILRYSLPDPNFWQGTAASSCANSIESLINQLQDLQIRLATESNQDPNLFSTLGALLGWTT